MKKIPTLFERVFENHKIVGITDKITPGCEDAFYNGVATVKFDGSCCAIIDSVFYKRYDCKKGKTPPKDAIPCCEPDPVTGHWPHWVKVNFNDPADKWFKEAYVNYIITARFLETMGLTKEDIIDNHTFEAMGPHFQSNPENLDRDILIPHGDSVITNLDRNFESVKEMLRDTEIEGIVFWLNDEPVCKIKRSDFGFEWPVKSKEE